MNDVSPERFRRHIETALAEGYAFVPANQIARGEAGPRSLAVTFDDGLASVATGAAPVLAGLGVPWSVFVVSSWADGAHREFSPLTLGWREIERLAAAGATVGSHSATHPCFATLDRERAVAELAESREMIRSRTGIEPREFAIPFGGSGDWDGGLSALARQAGYETVYAQSEVRRPAGTVARTFVTRFDGDRIFRAALGGAFDRWEEWR